MAIYPIYNGKLLNALHLFSKILFNLLYLNIDLNWLYYACF
jgi:hypothetical protein